MRYLCAFLLLQLAGAAPDSAAIIKVLEAAGVSYEEERIETLLSELEGKDINTLIAEGNSKLSSVPSGGAAAGGGAPAAGASGGAAAPAEEKKEEKVEEKEESDEDMGFGLFD